MKHICPYLLSEEKQASIYNNSERFSAGCFASWHLWLTLARVSSADMLETEAGSWKCFLGMQIQDSELGFEPPIIAPLELLTKIFFNYWELE